MQGKATFRGHPLHLMFVSFPVAFWTGAIGTDIAGALAHDPFWFRMSVTLIAMGTLGGALAAAFGYVDYVTAPPLTPAAKKVATGHLVWSLGSLAAFAAALALRWGDRASSLGIVATVVGSLVLLVAGYLGSLLAIRHHVGLPERVD